jgi:hypothetical protein
MDVMILQCICGLSMETQRLGRACAGFLSVKKVVLLHAAIALLKKSDSVLLQISQQHGHLEGSVE